MSITVAVALVTLAIWLYLLLGRGMFWLVQEREEDLRVTTPPATWPAVTVVIPARNEEELIADTVTSVLQQRYPGPLRLIVVDDSSTDRTVMAATEAIIHAGAQDSAEVVPGRPLPAGWTGKLWSLRQGIAIAEAEPQSSELLLLTDADIHWPPDVLRRLVTHMCSGGYALVSVMVALRSRSFAERALIPAFVYFFRQLYPFAWVNDPKRNTAAAAGGCMLLRADALRRIGGIDRIRSALIDDCALGRELKTQGPIWLGLSGRIESRRAYDHVNDIRAMVVRSAYAQLRYSPLLLAVCLVGLTLTYFAAPALAAFATGMARWIACAACALMMISFLPILRQYGRSPLWALAVPLIALTYAAFTIESAWHHGRGRGGMWKGRAQAAAEGH